MQLKPFCILLQCFIFSTVYAYILFVLFNILNCLSNNHTIITHIKYSETLQDCRCFWFNSLMNTNLVTIFTKSDQKHNENNWIINDLLYYYHYYNNIIIYFQQNSWGWSDLGHRNSKYRRIKVIFKDSRHGKDSF